VEASTSLMRKPPKPARSLKPAAVASSAPAPSKSTRLRLIRGRCSSPGGKPTGIAGGSSSTRMARRRKQKGTGPSDIHRHPSPDRRDRPPEDTTHVRGYGPIVDRAQRLILKRRLNPC